MAPLASTGYAYAMSFRVVMAERSSCWCVASVFIPLLYCLGQQTPCYVLDSVFCVLLFLDQPL